MNDLIEFYKQLKFKPNNKELFELAFTHSSFNAEANTKHHDYERLEFVGDSVLGCVVAYLIYNNHQNMSEGEMTKMKASLVQTKSLANKALKLNYDKYIRFGNTFKNEDIRKFPHILEDIFEAVLGALFLDQGYQFVNIFITSIFEDDIINFKIENLEDYKSKLQEAMQSEHRNTVTYKTTKTTGPAHDRTFFVEVSFMDCVLGHGVGKSKKEAEQNAACDALNKVAK